MQPDARPGNRDDRDEEGRRKAAAVSIHDAVVLSTRRKHTAPDGAIQYGYVSSSSHVVAEFLQIREFLSLR